MKSRLYLVGLFVLAGLPLSAAEAPWKASSEVSYVNTTGNSRNQTFSNKNKFDYDWAQAKLETKADAFFSKENNTTTAERYFASEKVGWKYDEPNYLFELGNWEKDRFSGVDSRFSLGGGYGRLFVDGKVHRFVAELGVQQTWEDLKNSDSESFASGRAFGEYQAKLSETSKFLQSVEYLKDFDNSESYRLNTITSVESRLTTILNLKVSYEIKYDSEPVAGFKKTDTLTSVSIVANFPE